ncbi:MAG: CotH kinase family protein, partial [Phaeodactylibacter sp.]|nr:CotH kinase family protein [Phaeodactylibacter sp.]
MNVKFYLVPFLAFCFFGSALQAQVVINELSAANRNTITDNYGEREDWFELYNAGSTAVDLSGYYLSDKVDNPTKWQIPNGVTIGPGQYRVVFASSRDEVSGSFLHTNFKLTQTKNDEGVVLSDPSGMILGLFVIIQPNQVNQSWGRETDGSNNWGVFTNPTPGGPNGGSFFQKYADDVSISMEAGFYPGAVTVELSTEEPDAVIHYTLDGYEPTASSPAYTGPLTIEETQVLRAAAFSNNAAVLPGFIETNTYFINEVHDLPVVSIAGDQILTLLNGSQIHPVATFELFESNGEFVAEAVGEYNEHGNDSWAYAQRGLDYITRDQFGYSNEVKHQIFPDLTDRDDFQRLILKAAANDNYPFSNGGAHIRDAYVHTLSQKAGMELDERTNQPCVLYANGQYWGLYEIREKVDDSDYTQYYYDQDEEWVDFIKTWGATWEEFGTWDDWYPLHDFITTNDMSDPANYDYVKTQLNVTSLVDYMIINTHVVCMDWLNWNTSWWRGRNPLGEARQWRYALWDLDATFGHYINYTGIPDTSPFADPCDNEDYSGFGDPQGHVDLIISLMENDDFHALYVNRYADFNNTYFTCDYMLGLLDEMIGEIESEMPAHIDRWGGSMTQWEDNVQDLIDFIETRCTIINGGIVDCYDVTG